MKSRLEDSMEKLDCLGSTGCTSVGQADGIPGRVGGGGVITFLKPDKIVLFPVR